MMEEFVFTVDRKTTVWERETYSIEDVSYKSAKNKMIDFCMGKENEASESFIESEILYETSEYMDPAQNGGDSTIELFNESNLLIYENG